MKKYFLSVILFSLFVIIKASPDSGKINNDRTYWVDLLCQMANPVLEHMSREELFKNMKLEVGPSWDGRPLQLGYMEAFGRLMAGIAPWLALPDDSSPEGLKRLHMRQLALKSYQHAVDPNSPDCLLWDQGGQVLVDASFIALSFLRAPHALWDPLDSITKQRYIQNFQKQRSVDPPYTNWLLFSATIESFLCSVNASFDTYRIHSAIRKIEEWYVGDGWYADGPQFSFDYYNSFVIQPMYLEVLKVLKSKGIIAGSGDFSRAVKRMQRYGVILERFISPEASFPLFGRSITYRMGVFQPLAQLSLENLLPAELPEGQVRNELTQVMKRMFANKDNFNESGFLQLGFVGHQPEIADSYTNSGSLYLTSFVFLPLGLPADHSFWMTEGLDWTSKKAWNGMSVPRDHAVHDLQ